MLNVIGSKWNPTKRGIVVRIGLAAALCSGAAMAPAYFMLAAFAGDSGKTASTDCQWKAVDIVFKPSASTEAVDKLFTSFSVMQSRDKLGSFHPLRVRQINLRPPSGVTIKQAIAQLRQDPLAASVMSYPEGFGAPAEDAVWGVTLSHYLSREEEEQWLQKSHPGFSDPGREHPDQAEIASTAARGGWGLANEWHNAFSVRVAVPRVREDELISEVLGSGLAATAKLSSSPCKCLKGFVDARFKEASDLKNVTEQLAGIGLKLPPGALKTDCALLVCTAADALALKSDLSVARVDDLFKRAARCGDRDVRGKKVVIAYFKRQLTGAELASWLHSHQGMVDVFDEEIKNPTIEVLSADLTDQKVGVGQENERYRSLNAKIAVPAGLEEEMAKKLLTLDCILDARPAVKFDWER